MGDPAEDLAPAGPIPFESHCAEYAQMTCQVASDCGCLGGYGIDLCIAYQTAQCQEPPCRRRRRGLPSIAGPACYGSAGERNISSTRKVWGELR